jgi:hypothetical protein
MCDRVILDVNPQSGYQFSSALAGHCQLHSFPLHKPRVQAHKLVMWRQYQNKMECRFSSSKTHFSVRTNCVLRSSGGLTPLKFSMFHSFAICKNRSTFFHAGISTWEKSHVKIACENTCSSRLQEEPLKSINDQIPACDRSLISSYVSFLYNA